VYAGSDDLDEVGWYYDGEYDYDEDVEVSPASIDCPQPVGGKAATRWGMHDLSGNVLEWCWDVSGDYVKGEVTDPTGAPTGPVRVSRGGSWNFTAGFVRAASRVRILPGSRVNYLGFRLSRTIP
jgi:formylglycine-generating enzyme required for sulfatase activity